MTDTATPTPEARLKTYHERRELAVTQPQGSLALVNTQWVDGEQTTQVGATGTWSVQVTGVLPPTGFTRLVAESSQGGVSPLFAYASRR